MKEEPPEEYDLLSNLLDLRLFHLLEPSLSDPHRSGERSEVFMLDLSQFSGQRLKHLLARTRPSAGVFIVKETRSGEVRGRGDTPRKVNHHIPRSPVDALERFTPASTA